MKGAWMWEGEEHQREESVILQDVLTPVDRAVANPGGYPTQQVLCLKVGNQGSRLA